MNTTHCADTFSSRPIRLKDRVLDVITAFKGSGIAIFKLLCEMQADYEMRQRMQRLDDRILEDIGRTRDEVDAEASKPIWHR